MFSLFQTATLISLLGLLYAFSPLSLQRSHPRSDPSRHHLDPRRGQQFASQQDGSLSSPDPARDGSSCVGNNSVSEWFPLGPEGGYVTSLVFHPDNPLLIYASSRTHPSLIHRTTNGGQNWSLLSTLDGSVSCLAFDLLMPGILYASTWGEHIFRSSDSGLTWTAFRTNTDSNYIYALTADPKKSGVVWAAADMMADGYVLMAAAQSSDAGSTWTFTPLTAGGWGAASAVAFHPSDTAVYIGGYHYDITYAPRPKIFMTTDGGRDWADISPDVAGLALSGYIHSLAIDPVDPRNIYAGGHFWDTHSNGFSLVKSTDGGVRWFPVSVDSAAIVHSLAIDPVLPHLVYAGAYDAVFRSEDGGLTWAYGGSGIVGHQNASLLLDPESTSRLYAGNQAGVFGTSDGALSWSFLSSGMIATKILCLAVGSDTDNIIYASIESDALHKSTDGGLTWMRLQEFSGCHGVEAMASDPQNVDKIYLFTGG